MLRTVEPVADQFSSLNDVARVAAYHPTPARLKSSDRIKERVDEVPDNYLPAQVCKLVGYGWVNFCSSAGNFRTPSPRG